MPRLIKFASAGALIFYASSGIASLLNYAFYPVIARFVSVAQYGEIQFLVSMFTQLAVGFVVLNILAIIIGAELRDDSKQKKAMHSLTVVASGVTSVIVVTGVIVLISQKDTLNLQHTAAIIALGLSLLVNVPFTIAIGKLQGNDRFIASGVISVLGSFLKLLFSVVFVALGYGVTGAIFGIFAGMAACLIIIELFNHYTIQPQTGHPRQPLLHKNHLTRLSFIKSRAVIALIAVTLITLLSAADSIVSRVVLTEADAGHYAAVATVAKMILAATSPLMWLALPPAIQHNNKLVSKYIAATLLLSITATLGFIVAPSFFTHTIIGVDPKEFIGLMPLAAVGMTLCSVAFIILTAAVCIGRLQGIITILLFTTILFVATFLVCSPAFGPLTASLCAQIAASAYILAGLTPKLFLIKNPGVN